VGPNPGEGGRNQEPGREKKQQERRARPLPGGKKGTRKGAEGEEKAVRKEGERRKRAKIQAKGITRLYPVHGPFPIKKGTSTLKTAGCLQSLGRS